MARRLTWVRNPVRNLNTVTGIAATDTANVLSVRGQSLAALPGLGTLYPTINNAFTLKRLLVWWQMVHRTAPTTIALPYGAIGAKVGSSEEFAEYTADPAFLASSGPLGAPQADWLMWNNVAAQAVSQAAAADAYIGRGMLDIRAQRRCDEVEEDIHIFSQIQNIAAADVTSISLVFAALVQTD